MSEKRCATYKAKFLDGFGKPFDLKVGDRLEVLFMKPNSDIIEFNMIREVAPAKDAPHPDCFYHGGRGCGNVNLSPSKDGGKG